MSEFRLNMDAEVAVRVTTRRLEQHQLRVVRNFDLRDALHSQNSPCTCPHHGTARCKCNYVVLLAYDMGEPGRRPAGKVVIHSHDGTTWLSVPATDDGPGIRHDFDADHRLLQAVAEVMYEADSQAV